MARKQETPRDSVRSIAERPHTTVLIIGAGINGAGSFRDLAMQGIDVVLIERGDFVSGASSASSHMIHGGIRYLENGEFRLVKESVAERNRLLRIAPHYVRPLQTTVPIFSTFSGILSAPLRFLTHKSGKPTERGALLIKAGLMIYDTFSRDGGAVPRHKFVGRRKSLAAMPALNADVKYTATYYDASMHDPERLALDVIHDGLSQGPHARAANYLEAVGANADGIMVRDHRTGEEFAISADVVINTSGPWTDKTNTALGTKTRFMGGTKGSHIVLDHPELYQATAGRELFFEHEDGRIVLIYPLKGRVMVGTTDLEHDMDQPIRCTTEEIDYFFDLVKHVYPSIAIDREHIVFRFSGVRPLPRHDDEAPGFVSRDYRIERTELPQLPGTTQLSLVGGKWTTFRALSEHIANEALEIIGRRRVRSTERVAIGGGYGYPTSPATRTAWVENHRGDLTYERADALLERYGTRAARIIEELGDEDRPLRSLPAYSTGEIKWLARNELVVRLDDMFLRRTSIAFVGAMTGDVLTELADIVGEVLGWSEHTRTNEINHAVRTLSDVHGIDLNEVSRHART